jgi:hypothetical protein
MAQIIDTIYDHIRFDLQGQRTELLAAGMSDGIFCHAQRGVRSAPIVLPNCPAPGSLSFGLVKRMGLMVFEPDHFFRLPFIPGRSQEESTGSKSIATIAAFWNSWPRWSTCSIVRQLLMVLLTASGAGIW